VRFRATSNARLSAPERALACRVKNETGSVWEGRKTPDVRIHLDIGKARTAHIAGWRTGSIRSIAVLDGWPDAAAEEPAGLAKRLETAERPASATVPAVV